MGKVKGPNLQRMTIMHLPSLVIHRMLTARSWWVGGEDQTRDYRPLEETWHRRTGGIVRHHHQKWSTTPNMISPKYRSLIGNTNLQLQIADLNNLKSSAPSTPVEEQTSPASQNKHPGRQTPKLPTSASSRRLKWMTSLFKLSTGFSPSPHMDCGDFIVAEGIDGAKAVWKRRRNKEGPSLEGVGEALGWKRGRRERSNYDRCGKTVGERRQSCIAQEGVSDAKNRFFSPLRLHSITTQILARLQRAWCHPPARMHPPHALPLRLPNL